MGLASRVASAHVVVGSLLVVAVVTVLSAFGIDPVATVLVAGSAFVLAVVAGRYVRGRRRSGPVWDDAARASREAATTAAGELADLRERRDRGEIGDAEFERRVDDLLARDSIHEAREAVEREGDDRPGDGAGASDPDREGED